VNEIREVCEDVYCLTWPLEGYGMNVSSTLVLISGHCIIVDTFSAPHYMEPFVRLLKGLEHENDVSSVNGSVKRFSEPSEGSSVASTRTLKDISIIYTHGDWDHCLGTSPLVEQFGDSCRIDIVSHDLTRTHLSSRIAEDIEKVRKSYPSLVRNARVCLPNVTFSERMNLYFEQSCGSGKKAVTLQLVHIGGHTQDSIACYVPEYQMLIAGDLVEDPIPSIGDPSGLVDWIGFLEACAQRVKLVIPSHGRPQGPAILQRNAEYLKSLVSLPQGIGISETSLIPNWSSGVYQQDTIDTYDAIHAMNVEVVGKCKMSPGKPRF